MILVSSPGVTKKGRTIEINHESWIFQTTPINYSTINQLSSLAPLQSPTATSPNHCASKEFAMSRRAPYLLLSLLLGISRPISIHANSSSSSQPQSPPPNIFLVLIDDLGWGDVGFHQEGNENINPKRYKEAQTPVMDELVKDGLELNRHYVHHSCTGTRTSLQSGRYPVHIQTSLKNPEDPASGMPRNLTGFAEYLKINNSYATHYVGKWDVGMYTLLSLRFIAILSIFPTRCYCFWIVM